jgi:hypothetical protein
VKDYRLRNTAGPLPSLKGKDRVWVWDEIDLGAIISSYRDLACRDGWPRSRAHRASSRSQIWAAACGVGAGLTPNVTVSIGPFQECFPVCERLGAVHDEQPRHRRRWSGPTAGIMMPHRANTPRSE